MPGLREGKWPDWDMASSWAWLACGDAWWESSYWLGVWLKSGLSDLSRVFLLWWSSGMTRVTERVVSLGCCPLKLGQKCPAPSADKSSWSLVAMLVQLVCALLAFVLGHFPQPNAGEEGSVEILAGTWDMKGILSLGISMGGPPGTVKIHGQSHWGYSYPHMVQLWDRELHWFYLPV